MQRENRCKFIEKMRPIGLLLTGLLLLSGCTKKEELLLSGEVSAENEEEIVFMGNTEKTVFSEAGSEGDAFAGGEEKPAEQENVPPSEPDQVCVHVCGAVKRPGVYELSVGCRVYEAVQAAGGFAEDADQDYVNQAQTLPDGVKLVIPTLEETALVRTSGMDGVTGEQTAQSEAGVWPMLGIMEESSMSGQKASTEDSRININTATETELCNIPGIGATRAAAIAAYRESHGSFKKPEDIMKVNGIKEGLYEKIKDSIRVD